MAIAFGILGALPGLAQQPGLRTYSIRDGLKYSQVFAVRQDRRGFVWAGTSFGISRYDGRGFVGLTSTEGLPHDSVRQIAEDDEGGIWLLTQEGLARIAPRTASSDVLALAPLPKDLAALGPREIRHVASGEGSVWFATSSRLLRLRSGTLTSVPFGPKLPDPIAWLGPVGQDWAWVGTARNVARVAIGTGASSYAVPAELGAPVSLAILRNETILLQDAGLSTLAGGHFVPDASWELEPGLDARGIVPLGERLVVPTRGRGVALLERGRPPRALSSDHGLPSDTIHGAAVDRDGLIWLATENGLVKIFNLALGSFPSRSPAIGSMVLAFAEEPAGGMWLGHSEGLSFVQEDRVRAISLGAGPREAVWALLALPEGGVLAGTTRRLVHVDDRRATPIAAIFPGTPRIQALRLAPDGWIWVTSAAGAARFRWDSKRRSATDVQLFTSIDGRPFGEGRGIDVGPGGEVWIGTDGDGVVQWDGSRFHRFGRESGLPSDTCRAVFATRDGIWVGTPFGVYVLSNGKARPVDATAKILGDRYAVAMVDDRDGDVWLALPYSLARIRQGNVVDSWDQSRGLVGSSTTSENCLKLDAHGNLWVGMVGGFSILGTAAVSKAPVDYQVLILTATDGAAKAVEPGAAIRHDANTLTVTYRSLTFVAEERTEFQERLLGYETEWSAPHGEAGQRYTNLAPGRYTLQVRAVGGSGDVGSRIAELPFRVEPPWWQTLPVRVAALLILAGLIYAAIHARTRHLRHRTAELEALVAIRTEQLEAANRELERLAGIDGLAGIANRRIFDSRMHEEWARALRLGTPLSLLMIDIDSFKAFNDRHGHLAGDECLRAVAQAISTQASRPGDLVARYGGEEFAVILPAVTAEGALAVAEKMRSAVEALAIDHPGSSVARHVTISAGVASCIPARDADMLELVAAADS
ncbi:MAG: diguanylate cyclase, partial [Thermoanaerobaculia bacterium]